MKKLFQYATIAFMALGIATTAQAATVTAGSTSNGDCTYGCVARLQQLYNGDLFGTSPVRITDISTFAYGGSYSGTYDVYISTSNRVVGSISNRFADNRGSDFQAFSSYTLSGTYAQGDLITFNGDFVYDPNAGDLLVEWVRQGGWRRDYSLAGAGAGDVSRVYSWINSANGIANQNYGLATQFSYESIAAVPLPAGMNLMVAGLMLLGAFRLVQRRSKA